MAWKKFFKVVDTNGTFGPISGSHNAPDWHGHEIKGNILPEIYSGNSNRIERYQTYENMMLDSEISAALDILAEFCTQLDDESKLGFNLYFKEPPTETETTILTKQLQAWYNLNKFEKRLFRIFRNVLTYGDQVFLRDPETFELSWIEMINVIKVIVNESQGKKPEQYVIKNLNPNFETLTVTQLPNDLAYGSGSLASGQATGGGGSGYSGGASASNQSGRFAYGMQERTVDAQHIVHLSLTEGLDANWPFGNSILELIFKVFKQKELLEDSIIIYRVQRAPERRVFKIDVGNMPSHLAMAFVERVKNEMHQRKIPTRGQGQNFADSAYNTVGVNEDFFFPQCLSLNTKIKLLDGRSLELSNIIDEYNNGKDNFTYTVNQETQKIESGKIIWAGITRKNAEVLKVTLDNDESVILTPDHRFIMRDGSEKEAQNLIEGDSIMPLYLDLAKTAKYQGVAKYTRYTCPSDGKKRWVHTMVCPKTRPGREFEIHHKDFNSLNNNPTNLIEMTHEAHMDLHRSNGSFYLQKAWNTEEGRKKLIDGIHEYHANATPEDKQMMRQRAANNAGFNSPVLRSRHGQRGKVRLAEVAKEKTIKYSPEMIKIIIGLYNDGFNSISTLCPVLRTDVQFQEAYIKANRNIKRDSYKPQNFHPTDASLNKFANKIGYSSWGDFKENYRYNHKIKSIEWLSEHIDTGDITIESENGNHNFALDIGIFVHNSSEGRGSSVETLPGGQNLSEIDDLRFFTNKMLRGLRIPSSYLPTGQEDSSAQVNDGRMGTALIQEFRFNQYCKRLQNLIVSVLDVEFKTFLKWRGINIDSSLFELKLNEPQNFAHYKQAELDSVKIGTFSSLEGYTYLSKRFLMEKYLGLSPEDMAKNAKLWREENKEPADASGEGDSPDLRNLGITPGSIDNDLEGLGPIDGEEDMGEPGEEGGETAGGTGGVGMAGVGEGGATPGVGGGSAGGGVTG